MTGITKSGFAYEVAEDLADDYELLDVLCEIDEGRTSLVTRMVKMVLGDEQTKKLKEHLRSETGKVSAEAMFREIEEIFTESGLKN